MDIGFIIDGAAVASSTQATFERRDPVTRVVASAERAFASWSETGPSARRALLMKAANLMERRTGDVVKSMLEETGATARRPRPACGSERAGERACVTAHPAAPSGRSGWRGRRA